MPWTCPDCSSPVTDDLKACPGCAAVKSSWTIVPDKTRQMQIPGRPSKLRVLRGTRAEPLPGDGALSFETVAAKVCPVVSVARARALRAAGQRPAPAHLVVARVRPPGGGDAVVTLTVDFARSDPAEREVERGDRPPAEDGSFDVPFLCVYGAGPGDLAFAGIEVLDVSEETSRGFAPAVEVEALKSTKELPTEAVPDDAGVELLEVEDISFGHDREVLLPDGWGRTDPITGLSVVAAALAYARARPDRRLLVCGHTDSRGSAKYNLALSERRATNVYLYLSGQRDAWAAHCQEHAVLADCQQVLRWAAYTLGWDCDPGAVDGAIGPKTRAARDALRARYNAEHQGSLATGGALSAADWRAYYDLYDRAVAAKLELEPGELAGARGALAFADPPTLPCGEGWPTERPGAAGPGADRRVDVLFCPPDDRPPTHETPPGASLYGQGTERRYLNVDDAMTEPMPAHEEAARNAADGGSPLLVECPLRHPGGGA